MIAAERRHSISIFSVFALIAVALICAAPLATAADLGEPIDTILDSADSITDWRSNATLTRDTQVKKRGSSSLKSVGNQTDRFKKTFATVRDVSKHRFLTFWYFIDDPSKITGGQVEITSSGGPDEQEFNWKIVDLHLQRGWNFVVLDLPGTKTGDSPIDLARINYFRLYHQVSGSVTTRIDHIAFSNRNPRSMAFSNYLDDRRLGTGATAIERFDPWLQTFDSLPSGSAARRQACRKQRMDQFAREITSNTLMDIGAAENRVRDLLRAQRMLMEYLCDERALTRTELLVKLEDRADAQVALVRHLGGLFGLNDEGAAEMLDRTFELDLQRIFGQCGTNYVELERYVLNGTVPSGIKGRNVLIRNCETSSDTAAPAEIANLIKGQGPAITDRKTKFQNCMSNFQKVGSDCSNPYATPADDRHAASIRAIKGMTNAQKDTAIKAMQDTIDWYEAVTVAMAREFDFETHPRNGAPNAARLEELHGQYDRNTAQVTWIEQALRELTTLDTPPPENAPPDEIRAHRERQYADQTRLYDALRDAEIERQKKGIEICAIDSQDPICKDLNVGPPSADNPPEPSSPETARCAAYTFKNGDKAWFDRSADSNGFTSQINEGDRLDHCLCELFDKGYIDSLPGSEFSKQLGGCPTPEELQVQRCIDDPYGDNGGIRFECWQHMRPSSVDRDALGGKMCEKKLPNCDPALLYTNSDGSCGCGVPNPTTGGVLLPQCTSIPNCGPDAMPTASGCGCQPLITGANVCTPGGKDFYLTNSLTDLTVRKFPTMPNFSDGNLLVAKQGKTRFVTPAFKRSQLFNDTTLVIRPVLTGTNYDGTGSIKLYCSNMASGGVKNKLVETIPMSSLGVGMPTAYFITLSNTEKAQCYGTDPNSDIHFEIFVDSKLGQPVAFYDILGDLGNIKPPCIDFPPRPTPGPRPLTTWPQTWTFSDGTVVTPYFKLNGVGVPPPGQNPGLPTTPNPPVCMVEGRVVPCP